MNCTLPLKGRLRAIFARRRYNWGVHNPSNFSAAYTYKIRYDQRRLSARRSLERTRATAAINCGTELLFVTGKIADNAFLRHRSV